MPKCIQPMTLKDNPQLLPCGACPNCRQNRVFGWAFRLVQQTKVSKSAHFLTLTYTNPPITKNGFMTVQKDDIQKFLKRLRKLHIGDQPIKYYAAAEYGENRQRPHYHLVIFNADPETFQKAWSLNGTEIGSIHVGECNDASVQYALKYIAKKSIIPTHKRDDRTKEFALMSKGLGSSYLSDNIRTYHQSDITGRPYLTTLDGYKMPMPRYYKDKIYTEDQKKLIQAHQEQETQKRYSTLTDQQKQRQMQTERAQREKLKRDQTKNLNNQTNHE